MTLMFRLLRVAPGFAVTLTPEENICKLVPVSRPVTESGVPGVQSAGPAAAMGNWPVPLAALSVMTKETGVVPRVPVQVPPKLGMYWAWSGTEASAQEPPVISAEPLTFCVPAVLVTRGTAV